MDADPFYMLFLSNLREDGKSYVLEIPGDGLCSPVRIKYEEVHQNAEDQSLQTMRDGIRTPQKERSGLYGRENRRRRRSHAPDPLFVASLPLDDSLEDESLAQFFDNVRVEDGFVVLDLEPGVVVKYEDVKEAFASSPGSRANGALIPSERELVPYAESPAVKESECDTRAIVTSSSVGWFQYKENLLEVLNKPYDHDEYEKLLKEATERKLLTKQKHLRGMSVSYATNIPGMSYFDHHPDLAKQFEGADCYRGLALLRGFFFWLKNLCHEGSFMPWTSTNAELLSTSGYELMLPLDDSPINEIRDAPLDVIALENKLAEDQTSGDLFLELDSN